MSTEAEGRGAAVIPTYPDLAGKVAVVTGGSGGIGAATCRLLAANGARVALHGREEAKIDAVVDENEVGEHGVRVNCLAPDPILTERTRSYMTEDQVRQWSAGFPLGRTGTPEDVAFATLFLASESSAWLTGVTLDVAGGKIML
jgi:NAD(P)-dependent dehydrogenase (short-subunit alcohol dehydrogenase family)